MTNIPSSADEMPDALTDAQRQVLRLLERRLKRGGLTAAKFEVLTELRDDLRRDPEWPTED